MKQYRLVFELSLIGVILVLIVGQWIYPSCQKAEIIRDYQKPTIISGDFVPYLESLDGTIKRGETLDDAGRRVFQKIVDDLRISEFHPGQLSGFYTVTGEAEKKRNSSASAPASQDRVNVFYVARFAINQRLFQINTSYSSMMLMDIFEDSEIPLTPEAELHLGQSITITGVRCIGYLKYIKKDHPRYRLASEFIKCIQEGRIYTGETREVGADPREISEYLLNGDGKIHFWETGEDAEERLHSSYVKVGAVIAEIDDVSVLKRIFYEVYRARMCQDSAPSEFRWRPMAYTELDVLYRLAEIKSEQSAKVLIDIFLDETVGYDAGASETLGDAIVKCGKPCLPYLEKIGQDHAKKDWAREMVQAIKEGRDGFF